MVSYMNITLLLRPVSLIPLLQSLALIENGSVAVSRIHEVATLLEEPDRAQLSDTPADWPSQGEVIFDNVKLRYKSVPLALLLMSFFDLPT